MIITGSRYGTVYVTNIKQVGTCIEARHKVLRTPCRTSGNFYMKYCKLLHALNNVSKYCCSPEKLQVTSTWNVGIKNVTSFLVLDTDSSHVILKFRLESSVRFCLVLIFWQLHLCIDDNNDIWNIIKTDYQYIHFTLYNTIRIMKYSNYNWIVTVLYGDKRYNISWNESYYVSIYHTIQQEYRVSVH